MLEIFLTIDPFFINNQDILLYQINPIVKGGILTRSIKNITSKVQTPKLIPQDVLTFLEDHKIEQAVLIDMCGKSSIAEAIIVASGRSQKHISITAQLLKDYLKESKSVSVMIEGLHCSDWVLVDAGHIIVHLFKPEIRQLYGLEKMWSSDRLREQDDPL